MTAEACRGMNTLRRFINGDFFQTFVWQWAVSPRGISCHLVPGFTPSMARFIHNYINSKEICQVFILWRQSTSNLICLVRFHRVTCHIQFIWPFKSHPYIHASTHQYFHVFTHSSVHNVHVHTQYQFTHDCISRPESCLVVSLQFSPQLFQVVSPN